MFTLFLVVVVLVLTLQALDMISPEDQPGFSFELDQECAEVPFIAPLWMEGGVTLLDADEEAREEYVLAWIEVTFGLDSAQQWETEEEATGVYQVSSLPLAVSCHRDEWERPSWRAEREELVRALEAWIYE